MIKISSRYYLPVVLILATIMVFLKIGTHDLSEWDESRNGQNAYEMYVNRDYINLYYGGVPDTWNAKPPLMIWCIVLCYKLFGFNEFALRLPAALSIIAFFYYFYRLVRRFHDELHASLACIILLSCKGIIGWHIGTNGDFDAMLLLFLTASAFHFMRFSAASAAKDIYISALFTGLAFYTKGPAACLYLPGFLLYLSIKPQGLYIFKNKHAWLSLLLFIGISCSWIALVLAYGVTTEQSHYGTSNSLQTLFIYDTFKRFTETVFDREPSKTGIDFLFPALDSRMNLWNYLF
jgi:4-amino-4-deoxy-L-arabinose transferase-like glycosyltransferase